ncbi:MAG: acetolactate synthase small subunit [Parcubacteria group bacterium]|nr:acetolactate synthase small subunit [Parcubacteria group bacterium]
MSQSSKEKKKHIVLLWVENKPGVLSKIASLCRRRRYNIDSITAGTSHQPGITHITIVFLEQKVKIGQIVSQIDKLIEVISIEALAPKDVIDKELLLLIVRDKQVADRLLKMSRHDVNVRIINTVDHQPVLEIVGEGREIDHVIAELDMKQDVVKMVKSGLVALKI